MQAWRIQLAYRPVGCHFQILHGQFEEPSAIGTGQQRRAALAISVEAVDDQHEDHTHARCDQTHDQGQVETVPDGQVVLRHFSTQNRAGSRVQEWTKGQAGNDADQQAGQYQNGTGDQHAARGLMRLPRQVGGDGAKKDLGNKAQGIGHAEGTCNDRYNGQGVFPGVAIAGQNGLGKEHFFGNKAIQ